MSQAFNFCWSFVGKSILDAVKDDATDILAKKQVNVDVFLNPKKYAVCLPVEKIIADSKVSREGVEIYKEKIRNNEKIEPLIVVKHPHKDIYAVLDGHHRYYAYAEMGKKQIDCALAGDYSSVIFYLTENGYVQPTVQFTKNIKQPVKKLHENLKAFLDSFIKK
jgi:hypothetical protein